MFLTPPLADPINFPRAHPIVAQHVSLLKTECLYNVQNVWKKHSGFWYYYMYPSYNCHYRKTVRNESISNFHLTWFTGVYRTGVYRYHILSPCTCSDAGIQSGEIQALLQELVEPQERQNVKYTRSGSRRVAGTVMGMYNRSCSYARFWMFDFWNMRVTSQRKHFQVFVAFISKCKFYVTKRKLDFSTVLKLFSRFFLNILKNSLFRN